MCGRYSTTIILLIVGLASFIRGLPEERNRLPKWSSTDFEHQPLDTSENLNSDVEDYFPDLEDEEEDFEDMKALRGSEGIYEETLVIGDGESMCLTVPTQKKEYHYLLRTSNKLRHLSIKCSFSSVSGEVFFEKRKVASFDSSSMLSNVPLTYRWTSHSPSSALLVVKRKGEGGEIICNVGAINRSKCDCGNVEKYESDAFNNPKSRIIKGAPVSPGSYPWIGALVYKGYSKLVQFCGASVISGKWMLTAAHCVQPFPFKDKFRLHVLLGTNNLGKISRENLHRVEKIIVHPNYDKYDVVNDVALLKMKIDVLTSGSKTGTPVRPICLPASKVSENTAVTVVGWGLTSISGDRSKLMQEATVHTLSNELCRKFYLMKDSLRSARKSISTKKVIDFKEIAGVFEIPIENSSYYLNFEPLQRIIKVPKLTGSTICANNFHTKSDSCSGDSGGPLILNSRSGNVIQVGIVSWGKGCGDPMKAGVYTDVFEYTDWIRGTTSIEPKCTTAL